MDPTLDQAHVVKCIGLKEAQNSPLKSPKLTLNNSITIVMTKILNKGCFGLGAQFEGKFWVLAPYSVFLLLARV